MSNHLFIWLPQWALESCGTPPPAHIPAASHQFSGRREVITCVNPQATACGVKIGMNVADARAGCPALYLVSQDNSQLIKSLQNMHLLWAQFTPIFAVEQVHHGLFFGVYMNIRGCIPLFPDVQSLLARLSNNITQRGHRHRIGLADSYEQAWGLAIYGMQHINIATKHNWRTLPVEAVRFKQDITHKLHQLGCHNLASLEPIKGQDFAKRFGLQAWERLQRFRGEIPSIPIHSEYKEDDLHYSKEYEPALREEDWLQAATHILPYLLKKLDANGVRMQTLNIILESLQNEGRAASVQCSLRTQTPSNMYSHWSELMRLSLASTEPPGLISQITLEADVVKHPGHTGKLTSDRIEYGRMWLLERLSQRLGAEHVIKLLPSLSQLPDQRTQHVSAVYAGELNHHTSHHHDVFLAPVVMLKQPEQITPVVPTAYAEPPMRWRWRGQAHDRRDMFGPDLYVPEWWLDLPQWRDGTRSYWWVQDDQGLWFWLYQTTEGNGEHWFVHGW